MNDQNPHIKNQMQTQGAVNVPSNLPIIADLIYAPCSGIWDGNEKGWTLVQPRKKSTKVKNSDC